jgi:hypothetical protein
MEQTTIAIDLAKSVFQVAVSSHHGSVEAERWLSRDRFLTYCVQHVPCDSRPTRWSRVGPALGDQEPMPPNERRRRDDKHRPVTLQRRSTSPEHRSGPTKRSATSEAQRDR